MLSYLDELILFRRLCYCIIGCNSVYTVYYGFCCQFFDWQFVYVC